MTEFVGLPSYGQSNATTSGSKLSTGAIAGISVGAGVAVSVIISVSSI
jgi:hypothetical protein